MAKKHNRRRWRPRPSIEEQQPEKRHRPREVEEKRNQSKAQLVDDSDFDESEEDEDDQNFNDIQTFYETGRGNECDVFLSVRNMTERRDCDKVSRCHKYLHNPDFCGYPVAEIYKIKLVVNKALLQSKIESGSLSDSLSGRLYGVIKTFSRNYDCEECTDTFFSLKKENAVPISLTLGNSSVELHLPLPRALPVHLRLALMFAFKFEFDNGEIIDLFDQYGNNNNELIDVEVFGGDGHAKCSGANFEHLGELHERTYCNCIKRHLLSFSSPYIIGRAKTLGVMGEDYWKDYWKHEILGMSAYIGIYNGIWFTVDVQILKEGVRELYGCIYARPCIFLSRIFLLSLESNQMCQLPSSRSLELTRPVVAIPYYSSLVIAALLYDQDGNVIVCDKIFFKPSSSEGTDSKTIGKGSVLINVKWDCNH